MRLVLFVIALAFGTQIFAQQGERYARVRIDLTNHEVGEITKLGLETDHGHIAPGQHLVNDFSYSEIELLKKAEIPYRIEIADVKKWYREQTAAKIIAAADARDSHCEGSNGPVVYDYDTPVNYTPGSMNGYFTYEEFIQNIDAMVAEYPNLISAKAPIGNIKTYEDRPIYWLRISDNPNMNEEEPEIFYNALHHAREANALSQLLFFMWYVLENYEEDPEIKFLLDETELYFVPMVNPDGYIFNQENDPLGGGLWRKNKWRDSDDNLKGVDLNRNYGYEWAYDDTGSSPDPNSSTYRGTEAFSEPETQAMKLFCEQHEFLITLNHHTTGNLLIHPWGFSDSPTAEDETFKTMGRVMNIENNYKLGTGTETVGYTVNGDSDDWMYGENTTKNASYSYTPESGQSFFGFWPPANEIDNINKSDVRMNLNAGLLAHNYLTAEDISPLLLVGSENKLELKLKHAGLDAGMNTVTVTTDDPIIFSVGAPHVSDLTHLEEEFIEVNFMVDPNLNVPKEVEFTITIDNGNYERTQEISKIIAPSAPVVILENDISNDNNFTSVDDWGITNEDFVSGPSSYTDSPGSNYSANRNDFVLYNQSFDLSKAIIANLNYYAKWDIEADYDYVQILAGTSPNPSTMEPLCGRYTNSGTANQALNEPLYDGIQETWIQETVSLEDFIGEEEVYFAFGLVSDGFVDGDGFYFDDLTIEVVNDIDTKNTTLTLNNEVVLIPNPTKDIFQIKLGNSFKKMTNLNYQIVDVAGKIIQSGNLESDQLSLENQSAGTYQVIIFENDKKLAVKRIAKI